MEKSLKVESAEGYELVHRFQAVYRQGLKEQNGWVMESRREKKLRRRIKRFKLSQGRT